MNEVWFEAPWPGVVHDFAVTETHIVVPFFPLITPDVEGLKEGRTFYEWHDDKPTMVAVMPRYGKAEDIRWFSGPTTSAGHMMNAVTEGTKVHLDVCLYNGNCFTFFKTPDGREGQGAPPILTRMTFDLARNDDGYETRPLCPIPCEMPRTDDRWQGRDYSHGWTLIRDPDDRQFDHRPHQREDRRDRHVAATAQNAVVPGAAIRAPRARQQGRRRLDPLDPQPARRRPQRDRRVRRAGDRQGADRAAAPAGADPLDLPRRVGARGGVRNRPLSRWRQWRERDRPWPRRRSEDDARAGSRRHHGDLCPLCLGHRPRRCATWR